MCWAICSKERDLAALAEKSVAEEVGRLGCWAVYYVSVGFDAWGHTSRVARDMMLTIVYEMIDEELRLGSEEIQLYIYVTLSILQLEVRGKSRR